MPAPSCHETFVSLVRLLCCVIVVLVRISHHLIKQSQFVLQQQRWCVELLYSASFHYLETFWFLPRCTSKKKIQISSDEKQYTVQSTRSRIIYRIRTYHYSVRVHDSVDSVCNRENGAVLKLGSNGFLDDSISPGSFWHKRAVKPPNKMIDVQSTWWRQMPILHLWSTLAVASSISRILVFLSSALARHKSCFCPTLKLSPPSVISPYNWPGNFSTLSFSCT